MSAPLNRQFTEVVPALGAAVTDSYAVFEAPFDGEVTGVAYVPDTDITGANTNSRTLTLVNKGADGNGTTVMATLAMTSGVNSSDFDEKALTLSAVAGATEFVEHDIIAFVSTAVGTGIADPGGTVIVDVTRASDEDE